MAPNPQIANIFGIPAQATVDTLIPVYVEMVNQGDEGDVYLNCWCASEGLSPYYPDARGIRLKSWRPALAGENLVYSEMRGLTDEYDPVTGYGLCGGCNPDGECYPTPVGVITLRFESGYLTPDPGGGWDLLHKTDDRAITLDLGGGVVEEGGFPWPVVAIVGGVALLGLVGVMYARRR